MSLSQHMVEVFSTTIAHPHQATVLKSMIQFHFPQLQIHFDLDDCDNILRIAYPDELNLREIEAISGQLGIQIRVLDE